MYGKNKIPTYNLKFREPNFGTNHSDNLLLSIIFLIVIIPNRKYYCPEIKSHTNSIISLIMRCMSQKLVNFVGKLHMTLIEPDFDMSD